MPLPKAWVAELFRRLSLRYGAVFMRQYGDLDPEAIKADWGAVLYCISAESIAYALQNLPADRAPNAMQFRDLCLSRPTAATRSLPAPHEQADPERVRRLIAGPKASLAGWKADSRDNLQWARNIVRRAETGEGLRPTRAALEIAIQALEYHESKHST